MEHSGIFQKPVFLWDSSSPAFCEDHAGDTDEVVTSKTKELNNSYKIKIIMNCARKLLLAA